MAALRNWSTLSPSRFRILAVVGLVVCVLLACKNAFIQDDAFISFRYADHLAHGQGLTWNPGERIEGYTNFLWTVLMAIPIALRLDPVSASWAFGILLFALTLVGTYRLGRDVLESPTYGLIVAGLVGTNFTFSSYATGGLETQLQACLLTWIAWLSLCRLRAAPATTGRTTIGISLLAASAVMTRMDSILCISALCAVPFFESVVRERDVRTRLIRAAQWLVPIGLIVGSWLAWKLRYYGDIVPNTFHLRIAGLRSMRHGIFYLYTFVTSYWLGPAIFVTALAAMRWGAIRREIRLAVIALCLWAAYIIWAGGDFMEFRFMVPVIPLLFLLVGWTLRQVRDVPFVSAGLIASILAGSLTHAVFYSWTNEIESIATLKGNLSVEGRDWVEVGRVLGRLFGENVGGGRVLIATSAAGAIPYYSRLDTVDMLGLNDRWVARNGLMLGVRPGHIREASFDYILSRRVNLVVGQPWVVPTETKFPAGARAEQVTQFRLPQVDARKVPQGTRVLEIPIRPGRKLFVLYLFPNRAVDGAIEKNHLKSDMISPA